MFQHKFGYLTGYSYETYNPPASEASKGGNKFNLKKKSTYPLYVVKEFVRLSVIKKKFIPPQVKRVGR